jgi:hypothetical protein
VSLLKQCFHAEQRSEGRSAFGPCGARRKVNTITLAHPARLDRWGRPPVFFSYQGRI